jgi:hypothetical protein
MLGVDLGTVRNGVVMVWRGNPLLHAVVPAEGLKRILSGVRGVSEISVGFSPYVDSSEILGVLKALCGAPPRQAGGREQGLVGPLPAEAEVPRAGRGRDRRPELRFGGVLHWIYAGNRNRGRICPLRPSSQSGPLGSATLAVARQFLILSPYCGFAIWDSDLKPSQGSRCRSVKFK